MTTGQWIFVIAVIVSAGLLLFAGCYKPVESEIGGRITSDEVRKEVVITISKHKEKLKQARVTDIYRGIFILAFAFGLFTFLRGSVKVGLATMGSSIGGLCLTHIDQKIAEIPWQYIAGATIIVIAFICFLYRDRIGKAAFRKSLNGGTLKKAEQKLVDKAKKEKMKNVSIS